MNKFKKEQYINQRFSSVSNTWSFQVVIRNDGDTITETFSEKKYGSARRAYDEALIYRNKKLLDIRNGLITNNGDIMLDTVFYETFDVLPVREETKRKHIMYFDKYINCHTQLKKVSRATIIQSLNNMIRTCSDDVIARVLSIWRRIYKTALIKEYITYDATLGIVPPKSQVISSKKADVITDRRTLDAVEEKIRESFSKIDARSVCTALEIMWYCGLRPCECFALNKDDIKDGYINIDKELGSDVADSSSEINTDCMNVIRKCKTNASIRKVPIPPGLQKVLDTYVCTGDKLLPNDKGGYFNVSRLGCRIHAFGIPFNMYQLRHTVATHLITNVNVDQRTAIEILGHEHIDMSIYYARSNDELKKKALDR